MNVTCREVVLLRVFRWFRPLFLQSIHSTRLCSKKNYYDVLEVPKSCSSKEIRDAYIRLSKEYHPDKNNQNSKISGKFVEINEAYGVLSKSESRVIYDTTLISKAGYGRNNFGKTSYSHSYSDMGDESNIESLRAFYERAQMQQRHSRSAPKIGSLKFALFLVMFSLLGGLLQYYIIKRAQKRRREVNQKQMADVLRTMKLRSKDKE